MKRFSLAVAGLCVIAFVSACQQVPKPMPSQRVSFDSKHPPIGWQRHIHGNGWAYGWVIWLPPDWKVITEPSTSPAILASSWMTQATDDVAIMVEVLGPIDFSVDRLHPLYGDSPNSLYDLSVESVSIPCARYLMKGNSGKVYEIHHVCVVSGLAVTANGPVQTASTRDYVLDLRCDERCDEYPELEASLLPLWRLMIASFVTELRSP